MNSDVFWKDVAAVQLNLSHLLKLQSHFDEALSVAVTALKSLDGNFSSNKAEVCHALDVVAELCTELGKFDEAMSYTDRALEVKSRIYGVSSPQSAKTYNIRGAIFMNTDRLDQSRSDYIRALGIGVRSHGRTPPLPLSVGVTLSNIAGVLVRQEGPQRVEECIALYREVVKSFESADNQSWMMGNGLCDLAECLIRRAGSRDIDEAKSLVTQALHIFLITRGASHPSTDRATALLQQASKTPINTTIAEVDTTNFVNTLLDEAEKIVPKKGDVKVSGDILFLDRRGHVGYGHPHTPLI
jgi:tetratricopeptide (TPR) repeat protein